LPEPIYACAAVQQESSLAIKPNEHLEQVVGNRAISIAEKIDDSDPPWTNQNVPWVEITVAAANQDLFSG